MSRVKNPTEKKRLSLERDRRNTYGENSKSSRKNISRSKQRQHMDERRKVGELLGHLSGQINEDEAAHLELLANTRVSESRRQGFKNGPDTPLGIVLANKKGRKAVRANPGRVFFPARTDPA